MRGGELSLHPGTTDARDPAGVDYDGAKDERLCGVCEVLGMQSADKTADHVKGAH